MVAKTAAIPNDFIHAMQVLRALQILWYCRVKMKEMCIMKSNNNAVVPEAREALDKFKMEAAADLDVPTSYRKITYTYRFGPLN